MNHSHKMSTALDLLIVIATIIPFSNGQLCSGVYVEPDSPRFRHCIHMDSNVIGDSSTPWHTTAGLTDDCLPRLAVEENTVQCYKWRYEGSCEEEEPTKLYLRHIDPRKELITKTPGSVSFTSPGFDSGSYRKQRLCVYNISIPSCENGTLVVRSTSDDHRLFEDGHDYLYLDFGEVPIIERGTDVGMLSEILPGTSFIAVFWSDSVKETSAGKFKMEAVCHLPV